MATLAGFSTGAWHRLLPLIWTTGGAFGLGGLLAALLAAGARWRLVLPVTAVTMAVVLVMAARGLSVLEEYFSLKDLARRINRTAGEDALVVCAGEPCDNPSLLFYLNRTIYWANAHPDREFASRVLKIGNPLFLTNDQLVKLWESGHSVYLICETEELPAWNQRLQARPPKVLEQSGTRFLLESTPVKN